MAARLSCKEYVAFVSADVVENGTIRKIPDSVKLSDLGELASFFADGVRANPFTKGLTSFIDAQTVIDDNVEMRGWAPADKHHCKRRWELVRLLRERMVPYNMLSTR